MSRREPPDLTERMLHLRQIPVGALMPPHALRSIASYTELVRFAAGDTLMREGEPIHALCMLTEGSLRLSRGGASVGELSAPQTLGFLGILARMDATYDATAETDVRAFELPTDTLLELMEEHPELLRATIRYLGERMYYDLQEMPAEALGLPFQEAPPIPDRPLDIVERVMVLRRGSAFTTASVNALTVMAKQLEELRLEPGVRLWRRGDPADHMFLVVSGAVTCTAEDGRTFRYGPGTAVGGLEALADKTRWYEPVTEVHTVGLRGRSDHLMDLFENYFSMAMDFVSSLARAQIGILARRTALGQRPLAVARDVSNLGAVKVGA